ncbi:hypothetical protein [Marinicella meishanensis]|uniref:hypothetical protein n=1 Tax=Marinicella meishanensis TaxID=2873263 RepID=UPI001CBF79DF|nr:hypothetical protein [Marinicella sp. NBU2979]
MSKHPFHTSEKPHKAAKLGLKRKTPIKVALQNPNSRKHAIFAHCWHCCGGVLEVTKHDSEIRREIRECGIESCSLHKFRQYKSKKPEALASGSGLDSSVKQISEVRHDD